MTVNHNILIIGAGRMAQAIIEGLKEKKEFKIVVTNRGDKERLQYVRNKYGVGITEKWDQEAVKSDIIILAMPPEAHQLILQELSNFINGQLVITVAAGIGPSYLEEKLPEGTPVAWVMPNTAARLGNSMTLYALGKNIKDIHVEWTESLISGIGEYEKVTEQQIINLTAVTGSAPAFIYRFAEALEEITLESGVTKKQARKLVTQMIAGAAEMLKTQEDPSLLANEVATPGGSTAAGLEVLNENDFNLLIRHAIMACREKARM